MEVLARKDSDREELQSALNRMMEAAASWKRERAQLVAACDQLRRQVRDRESGAAGSFERPQGELSAAGAVPPSWELEREQLLAQLNESQEGAGIALERQITAAVDRARSELLAENNKLREEIQRSSDGASQWAAERSQILTELERTTQLLADTEEAAAIALDRQVVTAVKHVRAEWSVEEEKLRSEVLRLQSERGEAAVSSEQVIEAVERARKEWTAERDRLRQELDAAMHLCARRGSESTELAAERDRLRQALEESAVALAEGENAAAEKLQTEVASAVERVRGDLEAERELLRSHAQEDLAELLTELDDSKALLGEAQSAYASAVSDLKQAERKSAELLEERDRLREKLEQLTDIAAQKELERLHLKEEYDRTQQILDEATAPRLSGGAGVTTDLVIAEEFRVEEQIRELSHLIDDPCSELSAVIRKTVERAQLDFYLKGLRFSATGESPPAD